MPDFSNCTSGCREGGHESWGECMRAKNTRVGWAGGTVTGYDATADRRWQSRINEFRAARAQGIKPDSSRLSDIRKAVQVSNETGRPYVTSR